MKEICSYGCGQEAKYQFKNGKFCCSSHFKKCDEFKRKHIEIYKIPWNKGKKIDFKKRIRDNTYINQIDTIELCYYGCRNIAKYKLKNNKICCSASINSCPNKKIKNKYHMIKEWSNSNSYYGSKEWKIKNSEGIKKVWNDKKSVYHTSSYWKNRAKGENLKPNKPESLLIEVFKILNLNYQFVGDYKIWINGKNPDFINEENKKIIEFFGWRHTEEATGMPNNQHEQERIDHFKKNGYDCLVIWENELKIMNNIINKIITFNSRRIDE